MIFLWQPEKVGNTFYRALYIRRYSILLLLDAIPYSSLLVQTASHRQSMDQCYLTSAGLAERELCSPASVSRDLGLSHSLMDGHWSLPRDGVVYLCVCVLDGVFPCLCRPVVLQWCHDTMFSVSIPKQYHSKKKRNISQSQNVTTRSRNSAPALSNRWASFGFKISFHF